MTVRCFKIIIFAFVSSIWITAKVIAQENKSEQQIHVAMRMIGHEFLLSLQDSVSLVLPVQKEVNRYKIQFEDEFQFDPEKLGGIIDHTIKKTKVADHYIVEMEQCQTKEVVYSYEIANNLDQSIIPCRGRIPPKDCYNLYLTILNSSEENNSVKYLNTEQLSKTDLETTGRNNNFLLLLIVPVLLLGVILVSSKKKRRNSTLSLNLLSIGKFQFDINNMEISLEDTTIELTSKESELLYLLYKSVNHTIEREDILKNVWKDEGDYVGRTLDVYVSKLRKKLELDSNVKIINIRGVGYKLVINE